MVDHIGVHVGTLCEKVADDILKILEAKVDQKTLRVALKVYQAVGATFPENVTIRECVVNGPEKHTHYATPAPEASDIEDDD